ncbi:cysteine hydrolase [Nordella sp. HKS 07]|uniref:cysteine hydrolase family protein n=1 Tax=Nordella sp. HKS 07 TaxID=2712222 RepID=UPI0013E1208A|nr:isochorismatase family cysteine hydrolase [Nordella sp. HKS 07]QIG47887.1 cysteine hydrolase [Nordella sp. HKS 07]
MTISGLRFGAIGKHAVHASIDMQRLFAEDTEWASPVVHAIAPKVARICAHAPHLTLFTRFLTPEHVEEAKGQWQIYYRHWKSVLASNIAADMLDLLPALRRFVPPARVIDKYVHSAFEAPAFQEALDDLNADTIIFTGVETDVCVLATALTAIDRGYRTILVSDAIASSNEASHEAAFDGIYPRFDQQVELIDTDTLLKAWSP